MYGGLCSQSKNKSPIPASFRYVPFYHMKMFNCRRPPGLNTHHLHFFFLRPGSHIECQYALSTFGIPRQALPVSTSGEMYSDQHMIWVETRLAFEAEQKLYNNNHLNGGMDKVVSNDIGFKAAPRFSWTSDQSSLGYDGTSNGGQLVIQPNDVLFGRGKTVVEHPGNLKFRNLVGNQMEEYEAASRLEKTCMTEKIVQLVHDSDGRFLKRDDGGDWEEVDHETARRKVAHAFRNRRKFSGMF